MQNLALKAYHGRIWRAFQPLNTDLSPYYHHSCWQPHISLAYGDLTTSMLPDILRWLEDQGNFT